MLTEAEKFRGARLTGCASSSSKRKAESPNLFCDDCGILYKVCVNSPLQFPAFWSVEYHTAMYVSTSNWHSVC